MTSISVDLRFSVTLWNISGRNNRSVGVPEGLSAIPSSSSLNAQTIAQPNAILSACRRQSISGRRPVGAHSSSEVLRIAEADGLVGVSSQFPLLLTLDANRRLLNVWLVSAAKSHQRRRRTRTEACDDTSVEINSLNHVVRGERPSRLKPDSFARIRREQMQNTEYFLRDNVLVPTDPALPTIAVRRLVAPEIDMTCQR